MATPPQNSQYPRNWNAPYHKWTGAQLLISNRLRQRPLTYDELTLYANHTAPSLRVIANTLRKEGRLTSAGEVVWDHPANQALQSHPCSQPLPDPGSRPATQTQVSTQLEARRLVDRVMSDSLSERGHSRFDRSAGRAILEEWIQSGAAGKDTPSFLRAWLDLAGTDTTGPPPPASIAEAHDRLLRLLLAVPRPAALRAIQSFKDLSSANAPLNHRPPLGHGPDGGSPPPPHEEGHLRGGELRLLEAPSQDNLPPPGQE